MYSQCTHRTFFLESYKCTRNVLIAFFFLRVNKLMIEPTEFDAIRFELEHRPLYNNKSRKQAGIGRSCTFGIVNRRCANPNYSRFNWLMPKLYKLLLDFGERNVDIPFNSITVNQNYRCKPHLDKNNVGESWLVAFGDYTGGQLEIHSSEGITKHHIKNNPIKKEFSKILHCVSEFEGSRYSLVYYWSPLGITLEPFSIKQGLTKGGKLKYFFYIGDRKVTYKLNRPDHPLRKVH